MSDGSSTRPTRSRIADCDNDAALKDPWLKDSRSAHRIAERRRTCRHVESETCEIPSRSPSGTRSNQISSHLDPEKQLGSVHICKYTYALTCRNALCSNALYKCTYARTDPNALRKLDKHQKNLTFHFKKLNRRRSFFKIKNRAIKKT